MRCPPHGQKKKHVSLKEDELTLAQIHTINTYDDNRELTFEENLLKHFRSTKSVVMKSVVVGEQQETELIGKMFHRVLCEKPTYLLGTW